MLQLLTLIYRYWVEQVGALNDMEGTKPIVIVGTHADQLSRAELSKRMQEIERLYPTISIGAKRSRSQVFSFLFFSFYSDIYVELNFNIITTRFMATLLLVSPKVHHLEYQN